MATPPSRMDPTDLLLTLFLQLVAPSQTPTPTDLLWETRDYSGHGRAKITRNLYFLFIHLSPKILSDPQLHNRTPALVNHISSGTHRHLVTALPQQIALSHTPTPSSIPGKPQPKLGKKAQRLNPDFHLSICFSKSSFLISFSALCLTP